MSYLLRAKALFQSRTADSSLRTRAAGAGAWLGVGFGAQKVLQFGSNLILTRLLFPEAFGLMALANVFLVGLSLFSDVGIKPSVIRDAHGDEPEFLNTAWSIQAYRGIILCIAGIAISYPVSLIYRQPVLFPLLAVLSSTALISGFNSIGFATAERRLDFKQVIIAQLLSQLVSITLLVAVSFTWRSVWALAVSNVLGSLATLVIGHLLLSSHRHQLTVKMEYAKTILAFGRWILLSTTATYLGGEGLRALQAWLISPAEFGVLAVAYSIAAVPNELTGKLIGAIGLPAMSEVYRRNPENAYSVLRNFRINSLAVSLLLFGIFMLMAKPAIGFLYDFRYANAGTYLLLLCLANAIAAITTSYNGALLAAGKSSDYFGSMTSLAIVRALGVFIGFRFGHIDGMILGLAAANLMFWIIAIYLVARMRLFDPKLDIFLISTTILFFAALYLANAII